MSKVGLLGEQLNLGRWASSNSRIYSFGQAGWRLSDDRKEVIKGLAGRCHEDEKKGISTRLFL